MRPRRLIAAALAVAGLALLAGPGTGTTGSADRALQRALDGLVAMPDGPPGAFALVNTAGRVRGLAAGTARTGTRDPIGSARRMRIASVSKAITGATALALVGQGRLNLDQAIGDVLPALPAAWHPVTLREVLNHTGGIPDFSDSPAFARAVTARPGTPPPPQDLLGFVADEPLEFPPGTRFRYSNSGPVIVGLMVQAVTGRSFPEVVRSLVTGPMGMPATALAQGLGVPAPALRGYAWDDAAPQPLNVTSVVAFGGWAWASGGFVSTPSDLSRFIRRDARGVVGMPFRPGASSPPGPGTNASGLGIFRYRTACGTLYGHTGSILGYTQVIMATADGRRSVVVSASTQARGPVLRALRGAWDTAACAAMAGP